MLEKFDIMWDVHSGRINSSEHCIETEPSNQRPIHSTSYRAERKAMDFEKENAERMLAEEVTEPAQTEQAAAIVFPPEEVWSLRFCIDIWNLNAVTVIDPYPLLSMEECIDSRGDASVFSTLDASSGYRQVEVKKADRDKAAFISHHGL